jgi:hypothetical protein
MKSSRPSDLVSSSTASVHGRSENSYFVSSAYLASVIETKRENAKSYATIAAIIIVIIAAGGWAKIIMMLGGENLNHEFLFLNGKPRLFLRSRVRQVKVTRRIEVKRQIRP